MKGTQVTCEDLETGQSVSVVIENDYVVITDGNRVVDGLQVYGNGTVVVTIKRKLAAGDGDLRRLRVRDR